MSNCLGGHPNITIKNAQDECLYQCMYKYHYGLGNIKGVHNNGYITVDYQTQNQDFPVVFQEEEYSISEMRIYAPSLHTFNGERKDAELVILHSRCYPEMNTTVNSKIVYDELTNFTIEKTLGGDGCFYTYNTQDEAEAQCKDPPRMPNSTANVPLCSGYIQIDDKKCNGKQWQLRTGAFTAASGSNAFKKEITEESKNNGECPNTLCVCIPLSKNASQGSATTTVLNQIIRETSALELGNHTDVFSFDSPFNLNKFIPDKNYYSYTAMGLDTSISPICCNYIVFDTPLGINSDQVENLNNNISQGPTANVNNEITLVKSQSPPKSLTGSSKKEDDIYIDCQPTNDSGQVLVSEEKSLEITKPIKPETESSDFTKSFWKYFYKFAGFILGILITIAIVMVARGIVEGKLFSLMYLIKLVVLGMMIGYLSTVVANKNDKNADLSVTDYLSKK